MVDTYSLRIGAFSRIINTRTVIIVVGLIFLTVAHLLLSLCIGKIPLSLWQVIGVFDELGVTDKSGIGFIVDTLRFPRIVMAALVGIALSLSGLILQTIVRNPLASPDILGVTTGASASAIFFMSFLAPIMSMQLLPIFAMIGAWFTAFLIYLLAWQRGITPMRLILVGIALSAVMGSITTLLLVLSPLTSSLSAYVWLTGSVYGTIWQDVQYFAMWLLGLLPLLMMASRCISLHELEDSIMTGLGLRPERERMLLLLLAVAFAAIAVAYAGAIAFVGLIAPHIAKNLVARTFAGLAITSSLVGANLVMLADLIGRTAFLPLDLPAGVFVAVMGTPFFIYLLIKNK